MEESRGHKGVAMGENYDAQAGEDQQSDYIRDPPPPCSPQLQQPASLNTEDTTIQQPPQLTQEEYFAAFDQNPLPAPPPPPRLSKVLPVPGTYHHRPPPSPTEPWLHYPSGPLTIGLIEHLTQYRIGPLKRFKPSRSFQWWYSPGIPNHQSMHLELLSANLRNQVYQSLRDFMRDFYLIVENAPPARRRDAEAMRHWWETEMEEFKLKGWSVEEPMVLD